MQKSRSIVRVLASLLILAAPFCAAAPQQPHVTSEQVMLAVQEVEKLAQKQIDQNAVPGLAIAVVFQDKVVYSERIWRARCKYKGAGGCGHGVPGPA